MDDERRLLPIRCPGVVWDKSKEKARKCDTLCLKVFPGSSGECKCRLCKLTFRFYVDSQAKSLLAVKVKPVKKDTL